MPPVYKACLGAYPNPQAQTQAANVCIHVPQIADPLNDPAFPQARVATPVASDYAVPTSAGCPSGTRFPSASPGNSNALTIASDATICPGIYHGSLHISAGTATMLPGFYYLAGKNGLKVNGTASLDGTAGVTIYNSANLGKWQRLHPAQPGPGRTDRAEPAPPDCQQDGVRREESQRRGR